VDAAKLLDALADGWIEWTQPSHKMCNLNNLESRGRMSFRIYAALLMLVFSAGTTVAAPPAIIAHRGASHDAPENTLAAIRLGFEQGADFVEVDLRLTADQQIVLMHDGDTKRTAGRDKKVAEQTLQELKTLDAGSFKGAKWTGERIPTLAEALAAIPAGKGIFLELKAGPEIVPPLAEVLKSSKLAREQIVIIAFDFAAITEAKRRLPDYQALWLVAFKKSDNGTSWTPAPEKIIDQARGHVDGLDLKACAAIDAELIKQAKSAGLSVYTWTVNDPVVARQMKDVGVLGITTDRPRMLRDSLVPR
jgi:glycerophosphoryl diester phosphodiesterase